MYNIWKAYLVTWKNWGYSIENCLPKSPKYGYISLALQINSMFVHPKYSGYF